MRWRSSVSVATLRRRLVTEGTGWQQVVDELRRDRPMRMLADRRQASKVALSLGYGDARSCTGPFASGPAPRRPTATVEATATELQGLDERATGGVRPSLSGVVSEQGVTGS
jgi:hypothetical protein